MPNCDLSGDGMGSLSPSNKERRKTKTYRFKRNDKRCAGEAMALCAEHVDLGVTQNDAPTEEGVVLRVHSSHDARLGRNGSTGLTDSDIARELHDSVSQQLTAVSMLLGRIGRSMAGRNIAQADEIHRIEEHLLSVTREVRDLSHRAKTPGITAEGFTRAIRALAEDVRVSAGIPTILMLTESPLPDDATAEHLFRIVQEAIHNVIKHARASRLRVLFTIEEHAFVVVVRDDGNGICAEARAQHGMGLDAMASRARAIGAHLEVRSISGRGTAVRCVLPF